MPSLTPLSSEEAVAAVLAVAGPPPESGKYVAHHDENSLLLTVAIEDAQDRGFPYVWAGAGWLVGPDRHVFKLSSNYGIHDWTVAKPLLERLYRAGLMARVEPDYFVQRLQRLTNDRAALVDQVVEEVKEGRLRPPRPRVLP